MLQMRHPSDPRMRYVCDVFAFKRQSHCSMCLQTAFQTYTKTLFVRVMSKLRRRETMWSTILLEVIGLGPVLKIDSASYATDDVQSLS